MYLYILGGSIINRQIQSDKKSFTVAGKFVRFLLFYNKIYELLEHCNFHNY